MGASHGPCDPPTDYSEREAELRKLAIPGKRALPKEKGGPGWGSAVAMYMSSRSKRRYVHTHTAFHLRMHTEIGDEQEYIWDHGVIVRSLLMHTKLSSK